MHVYINTVYSLFKYNTANHLNRGQQILGLVNTESKSLIMKLGPGVFI